MGAKPQTQLAADESTRQLKEIYDLYRTALLNKLYYADALCVWSRLDTGLDFTILIGTSSSIGSYAIWKSGFGLHAWAVLSGVAAVCGILKQVLQVSKRVQRYTKLHTGHTSLYYDLNEIVGKLRVSHILSPDLIARYHQAVERYKALALEDDPHVSNRRRSRCQALVLRQIPNESLWTS
jgi:hypothetical protein